MDNYYQSQLNRLQKDDIYPFKIQLFGDNTRTNHLDLNKESIPVLIDFLTKLEKEL